MSSCYLVEASEMENELHYDFFDALSSFVKAIERGAESAELRWSA
jgi:hypothetical protein